MSLITKLAESGMKIDDKFKINFVVTGLDPVYRDDAILQCISLHSLKFLLKTKDLAKKMDDVSQLYPNLMISEYQRQEIPSSLTRRMPRNGHWVSRDSGEQRPHMNDYRSFNLKVHRPFNSGSHPYSRFPPILRTISVLFLASDSHQQPKEMLATIATDWIIS